MFAANGEYSGLNEYDSKFSPAGFREQLKFTNDKIRGIVDGLLSGPEETRPIIIIEADEGPYPDRYSKDEVGFDWAKATDAELETKYGVLAAMYLPGDAPAGTPEMYPDMTLINTWPIVLDRYFDAGIPLLPDKSYTSRSWVRPYDLTDITGRLAADRGTRVRSSTHPAPPGHRRAAAHRQRLGPRLIHRRTLTAGGRTVQRGARLVAGVDSSTQSTTVVVVDAETGEQVARGRAAHEVTGAAVPARATRSAGGRRSVTPSR